MSKTPKKSPTAPRRFTMRTPFSAGAEPADTMSADTNDKADATAAMTNLRRAKHLWYGPSGPTSSEVYGL